TSAKFSRIGRRPPIASRGWRMESENAMESVKGLAGLQNKIAARLAAKPGIFILHPAELRILRSMSDQDLRAFAAANGWRVIRRLGGRQIEFYNDASTRGE